MHENDTLKLLNRKHSKKQVLELINNLNNIGINNINIDMMFGINVENKETFISRRTKTGVLTGLSAVAAGVAGYGLTTLASTMGLVDPTALTFAIGTGVITILGSIPAFSKLMQNHGKVKELEKQYLENKRNYLKKNLDKLSIVDIINNNDTYIQKEYKYNNY